METSVEQILASKVRVQYLGSVRIRWYLVSKTLSNEMDNVVNSIEKKQNSDNYCFKLNIQNIFRENTSDFDMHKILISFCISN